MRLNNEQNHHDQDTHLAMSWPWLSGSRKEIQEKQVSVCEKCWERFSVAKLITMVTGIILCGLSSMSGAVELVAGASPISVPIDASGKYPEAGIFDLANGPQGRFAVGQFVLTGGDAPQGPFTCGNIPESLNSKYATSDRLVYGFEIAPDVVMGLNLNSKLSYRDRVAGGSANVEGSFQILSSASATTTTGIALRCGSYPYGANISFAISEIWPALSSWAASGNILLYAGPNAKAGKREITLRYYLNNRFIATLYTGTVDIIGKRTCTINLTPQNIDFGNLDATKVEQKTVPQTLTIACQDGNALDPVSVTVKFTGKPYYTSNPTYLQLVRPDGNIVGWVNLPKPSNWSGESNVQFNGKMNTLTGNSWNNISTILKWQTVFNTGLQPMSYGRGTGKATLQVGWP